jgi:predicted house-cleaning noncanonical NTP pyrophosphatase (MazG superfamily)
MFLFGVSLIILIPYSESIIKSTQSKKKIKEIVSRIDSKIIDSTKETKQTITISDYIESIEENPIFILSEIGRRTLEDGERLIPLSILLECEKKMLEILNNTPDFVSRGKRKTINTFLIIIKGISYQAIKLHVEGTLLTVLRVIESVHNYCAVNKIPWSEVIELDEFIEELLEKTLDSSLDETTLRGLHMIERIMIKHLLNNMPKEDEIWLLQFRKNKDIKHSPEKDLQWEHISKDYMRILYKITEKALDIKKGEIVNTGLFSLKNIGSQILDTHLGDLQKREIVDWCYYYLKELIIRSVDEGLYQKHLLLVPFYFSDIEECLTQGKEFSKIPLIVFGQILLILNKKKVLDTSILNEFGTVGRLCVRKITETSLYKQALIFIIRVFNKLREEIQEILDDNNKTIYLELYNQTISLRGWMEEHKKEDKEISDLINNVLSNFSLYENIKTELEKGIIKWPSLENNN